MVEDLIKNAVLAEPVDDAIPGVDMPLPKRAREDRPKVSDAAMHRIMELEEEEKKRRKSLGIIDAATPV
jgi:hypothetical protein